VSPASFNVEMDPSQLTLFHFDKFANKRPRTEQSSQGQSVVSPPQSSKSNPMQPVSDSQGDAMQLHQDSTELSEVSDNDISDSESPYNDSVIVTSWRPGQSCSLTRSPEANSIEPILIDSSSDDSSNCSNAFGAEGNITEQQTCSVAPSCPSLTDLAQNSTTDSTPTTPFATQEPPSDIAHNPLCAPVRPKNIKFPTTMFSKTSRCFNPAWYKKYNWLEYSIERDACFCYPCHLFGSQGSTFSSRPEPVFTSVGFRNWKHATGKTGALQVHSNCYSHKQAVIAWEQYKVNAKHGTLLPDQMGSSRDAVISKNRHYLRSVAEVLLLCSRQEIALRGHRESVESQNRGNFLELLALVAKHDPIVQERISQGPRNATYTSPAIQNDILRTMAGMVQAEICAAVNKAGVFSILADESKDCSKKEQLAIVLRYVDDSAAQNERFLTYVEAKALNAEGLASDILETLNQHKLDPSAIVSQGYDGASVMSGNCSGVQTRIKEVAPMAMYVHCYAHCLNLVLVDSTKNVREAAEFFALMETLYVFISAAKAHTIYIEQQTVLYPNKPVRQLQRLSDTRWACRFFAVDAVYTTYGAILATLQMIVDGDDREKATKAMGIFLQVQSFKFLTSLVLFWRVLSITKGLSDQLQNTKINLAKAADLVTASIKTLQEFRSDTEWDKLYKYVTDAAKLHDISEAPPRPRRQRRLPSRLSADAGVLVLETTGFRETLTASHDYKICLYYPVLDAIILELNSRFANKNLDMMKCIHCCNPESPHFLDFNSLTAFAEMYGLDKETLSMECKLALRTLSGKEMESINDVFVELLPLKAAFPVLVKMIRIALTIVVSTAECERSFSTLKRTKTYLRSSMSEQRLTDLAVLSIERELSQNLSLDKIVDKFALKHNRGRIQLS